ncbi:hypothetical protein CLV62_12332 [Dysgonomonas alginatilytica]|uniref:Uncharacterized protein n=1 Tax=Dysgonomonas alginatilytica TaxID=1605892 RepID=A0A2V3PLC5_9BACT|nr:hypothetical protein [Dysgonomonas alginatilytica]PXV61989.1 hypothetical protein CLV62_12332 [Dysgonomonas alginatilytica]
MAQENDSTSKADLDRRLGAPMKKSEGLCSDKKRSESEHLHAYREDVNISNENEKAKTEK